ncbi:MAG: hypothetical protein WCP01_03360 [Methylococcaceae bacterium]|jgi:hypothetical protein
MKKLFVYVLAGLLMFGTTPIWADTGILQKQILFKKGTSGTTVSGKIKGHETLDYQLRAKAGQIMTVDFKVGKGAVYFNILPPGSDAALFIGSSSGNHFKGELPANGVYTIRVYLMGGAKDGNKTVNYSLKINLPVSK